MALNGLKTLSKNLSELDLEQEQYQIIEDNKDELVLAQTEVLSEGKDRFGNKRSDNYAELTIAMKNQFGVGLGRVTDRVTFYMTGLLYSSLFAKISRKSYVIEADSKRYEEGGSTVDTYTKMVGRIGKENYGLDPQRTFMFKHKITIPKLKEVFYKKTGLTL